MAMQFMPNSPMPPSGTICNFPFDISKSMLAHGKVRVETRLARRPARRPEARQAASLRKSGSGWSPADKLHIQDGGRKKILDAAPARRGDPRRPGAYLRYGQGRSGSLPDAAARGPRPAAGHSSGGL